jgi:hypothetical protein
MRQIGACGMMIVRQQAAETAGGAAEGAARRICGGIAVRMPAGTPATEVGEREIEGEIEGERGREAVANIH